MRTEPRHPLLKYFRMFGHKIVSVSGLVAVAFLPLEGGASKLTIVRDGKSDYVIVLPGKGDTARVQRAGNVLRSILAKSTGAELPIVKEPEKTGGKPAFYLGKTESARRAGLPVDKITGWAYLNQVVGKDIYLVGHDGLSPVKGRYPIEYLGTLKAVTAFLESQVGVRFVLPGAYGTHIPRHRTLTIDANMKVLWQPVFDYVIGRAPRDRPYGVALNLFGGTDVLYSYGGHSYYAAVPAERYGKTHKEYFALIGGVRTPRGNHLCISNPDSRG